MSKIAYQLIAFQTIIFFFTVSSIKAQTTTLE
jgi:hypothetical protein